VRERRVVTLGWPELTELDAYQITEIPRRPDVGEGYPRDQPDDPGRTQRLAALLAAYHAGLSVTGHGHGALALGWVRASADGPLQILTAGPALVGGRDDREVLLTLPAGARAQPLPRGGLATLLGQLPCWRAIVKISDGLRPDVPRRTGERPLGALGIAPSLEDCLLAVWPGAFGWLLAAEPVAGGESGQSAGQEPRQDASTGLWRVRLAAGGTDADAAARVAGLVCASASLAELPYALAPAERDACGLPELMRAQSPSPADGDPVPGYSFCASSALVAALARPP
jgi:uncharacterized protein